VGLWRLPVGGGVAGRRALLPAGALQELAICQALPAVGRAAAATQQLRPENVW